MLTTGEGDQPPHKPRLRPRHCSLCGRFLRRDGKCPKATWDDYNGAWEHE
jgi:hypothetical protein